MVSTTVRDTTLKIFPSVHTMSDRRFSSSCYNIRNASRRGLLTAANFLEVELAFPLTISPALGDFSDSEYVDGSMLAYSWDRCFYCASFFLRPVVNVELS